MITREEKINQKLAAKKALDEVDRNINFSVKVGHNVPTWVVPRKVKPKTEVIAKFRKRNNSYKNNIEIL